ncbi:MAG TPA: hypothetical protein DD435_08880 [Cyanobacteria bacterium UBA8530]|nr:hypothetical protein [Cyanobacteria bacterium UBA8530]
MAGTQKLGPQPSIPIPVRKAQSSQENSASPLPTAQGDYQLPSAGSAMKGYAPLDQAALKLTPRQKAAYDALSPGEQQSFHSLYCAQGGNAEAQAGLCQILERPPLLKSTDNNGKNLLSVLDGVNGKKGQSSLENAGLSSNQLVASLVKQLNNPADVYQGDNRTCAVASLQTYLATSDPAEYCRLATDLWEKGETKFKNGQDILLTSPRAGDKRNPLDAMLQESWIETAKDFSPTDSESRGEGDGSLLEGMEALGKALLKYLPVNSVLSFLTGKKEAEINAEGLTSNQIRSLYGSAMSAVPTVVDVQSNLAKSFNKLTEMLDAGHCVTVGLKTASGACHCVNVLGTNNGKVSFSDPLNGKIKEMPSEKFEKMMAIMVVPEEYAEGYVGKSIVNSIENFAGDADEYGGRGGGSGSSR